MTPTIERDERGHWVRAVCPDGIERRIGPFTTAGNAAAFIALHLWGL